MIPQSPQIDVSPRAIRTYVAGLLCLVNPQRSGNPAAAKPEQIQN
jgi:hypothetical protein